MIPDGEAQDEPARQHGMRQEHFSRGVDLIEQLAVGFIAAAPAEADQR
jgi:hypothetical protein